MEKRVLVMDARTCILPLMSYQRGRSPTKTMKGRRTLLNFSPWRENELGASVSNKAVIESPALAHRVLWVVSAAAAAGHLRTLAFENVTADLLHRGPNFLAPDIIGQRQACHALVFCNRTAKIIPAFGNLEKSSQWPFSAQLLLLRCLPPW